MHERDWLLAVDNGTQSLRALIFDGHGQLVAKTQEPFQPYVSPAPGWAEQDPEIYWQAFGQACQGLWSAVPGSKERIAGVVVTTQRATVLCLDAEGRPLRPAIHWLDQRTTAIEKKVGGFWGLAFRLVGLSGTVAYLQRNAESNWLRAHDRDVWRRTKKFVLLSGFLNHRLTGRFVDSTGSQVGYLPFDYKKQCWAGARDWKWDALGIPPEMLTDLEPPGKEIGTITQKASEHTGIPQGLPVITGAADKACEVLGAGSLHPHIASLSLGTTATINTLHRRYVEAIPFIPPYPAPVPGAWCTEIQVFRGYWMVEWFKREFGHIETARAQADGLCVEALFEELLDQTKPGAEGLVLQPYWSPGLKVPGPEARGSIIGFTDRHGRAHVYRAIIEGIAYALRAGKERLERRAGTAITAVHASGGGSQSDGSLQITADIFGLPVSRFRVYEASGLGAAIIAAVALGIHPDHESAARSMVHVADVFEPDSKNQMVYDRLFNKVYKKLFPGLKRIFKDLLEG